MPSKLDHNGCQFHNHGNNYLHQLQVAPTKRRGPIGAEFSSPGPAIVSLPSAFGPNSRGPSYTFGSKHEEKKDAQTPGPGEYDVEGLTRIGKDWTPAAFVGAKYKNPEPFNTPSPTQYSPERSLYSARGRQAPSYTFGFKTKDPLRDATPGPGNYNVPEPESYKSVKQPMFSFRPKTTMPQDKSPKPGPADYIPEKVWINKTSPPSMSFGSRPSPYALSF